MLRLAVRACKGDEEGHNLVFMSYGDFCTLAGGGHHESVRVVLQDSHLFFVRISMDMQRGSIGLDALQRSTMQMTLGDRVAVRLFSEGGPEGGLVPIRKLFLSVDLLSQSSKHRHQIQFDSGDLVKTVRKCFVDNTLQSKQYILAVSEGARLRLRVIGLDTPNTDLAIALCMSQHERLGAVSGLGILRSAHLRRIADLVSGQGTTSCNFVFTRETAVACRAQPNSPINLRQQVRTMFFDKNSQHGGAHSQPRTEPPHAPSSLQQQGEGSDAGWSFSAGPGGSVLVAAAAGSGDDETRLLRGDIIESVNGQSVAGRSAQEVEALAKGPAGSLVTFGIMRGSLYKFITLEREAREPRFAQNGHHSAAHEVSSPYHQGLPYGLSGSSSPGASHSRDRSIQRSGHRTPPAFNLFQSPPLNPTDDPTATVGRRSRTPESSIGAPDSDDLEWHVRSSPYAAGNSFHAGDGRLNVSAVVEDLTRENKRLRAALRGQQIQSKELRDLLDAMRHRTSLAEKLAEGMSTQLQVFQHHLHHFHSCILHQAEVEKSLRQRLHEAENEVVRAREDLERMNLYSPRSQAREERDSIAKLEEMVETLLTVGEQEVVELNSHLKRENLDLKLIFAQLQQAERAQAGGMYNLAGVLPGAVRTARLESPPRAMSHADVSAQSSPGRTTTRSLGALSANLRHITSSTSGPSLGRPERNPDAAAKGGFYVSLSAATASLFSTSPELKPLTAPMSPFVTKSPPMTWEDAMSQLTLSHRKDPASAMKKMNSAHRDPRHSLPVFATGGEEERKGNEAPHKARMSASHLTWEDAMSGYSRLTNTSLSMSSGRWDTPDKYYKSGKAASPSTTLNDASVEIEIEGEGASEHSIHSSLVAEKDRDSIMGNFLTKDLRHANMQRNKWAPPPFEWETWEQERKPCNWAAEKAGIKASAVGTIHKLLLKGKTLGQVVRNHSVADLNLREETIHDYIHHCTVFGMTYFGRKPRWVLQYLQSGPDDAAIPALENPSPPQHKMETPPDEGLSRQRTEITRGASRPSRSAPSPPRGVRKENPVAAAMQGIAAAVSPAPAHAALDGIAGAISPPSPRTSPSDGFVGMQLNSDNGKAPFHVIVVNDLMDRNHRLQGERGYSNPLVRPGDELTHISSKPVAGSSLDDIHALLRGPRGSGVNLTFTRNDGIQAHSFVVQAVRHAAHEFDRSYSHSPAPSQGIWDREILTVAEASVMSSPSPPAKGHGAQLASVHGQSNARAHSSRIGSESPEPMSSPGDALSEVLSTVLGSGASRPTSQAGSSSSSRPISIDSQARARGSPKPVALSQAPKPQTPRASNI